MFLNSAASLLNLSGETSARVDTATQNCSEEGDEPQNLQEPEEDNGADSEPCDGVVEPSQVRFDRKKNQYYTSIYNIYSKLTSIGFILTQREVS